MVSRCDITIELGENLEINLSFKGTDRPLDTAEIIMSIRPNNSFQSTTFQQKQKLVDSYVTMGFTPEQCINELGVGVFSYDIWISDPPNYAKPIRRGILQVVQPTTLIEPTVP